MPIKIKCPGCSKVLGIPEKFAGKAVKCPSCQKPLKVPAGGDAAAPPAPKPETKPAPAAGEQPAAKKPAPPAPPPPQPEPEAPEEGEEEAATEGEAPKKPRAAGRRGAGASRRGAAGASRRGRAGGAASSRRGAAGGGAGARSSRRGGAGTSRRGAGGGTSRRGRGGGGSAAAPVEGAPAGAILRLVAAIIDIIVYMGITIGLAIAILGAVVMSIISSLSGGGGENAEDAASLLREHGRAALVQVERVESFVFPAAHAAEDEDLDSVNPDAGVDDLGMTPEGMDEATGETTTDEADAAPQEPAGPSPLGFAVFLLPLLYYVVLEGLMGATLGKLALGMRVVKAADKTPCGFVKALLRNIIRFVPVVNLGIFIIPFTGRRQGLHDMIAGTLVLKKGAEEEEEDDEDEDDVDDLDDDLDEEDEDEEEDED